jgi:hypothetical protein
MRLGRPACGAALGSHARRFETTVATASGPPATPATPAPLAIATLSTFITLATVALRTTRLASRVGSGGRAGGTGRLLAALVGRTTARPAAGLAVAAALVAGTAASGARLVAPTLTGASAAPAMLPAAPSAIAIAALALDRLGNRSTRPRHHAHPIGTRADSQEPARTLLDHRDHHFGAREAERLEALADRVFQCPAFEDRTFVTHERTSCGSTVPLRGRWMPGCDVCGPFCVGGARRDDGVARLFSGA